MLLSWRFAVDLALAKFFLKKCFTDPMGFGILFLALKSVPPERAFSSGGERFPDTEEVTSSNLVTPTTKLQVGGHGSPTFFVSVQTTVQVAVHI